LIVTLGTLFALQGVVLGFSVLVTGTTSVALEASPWAKFLFGQFIGGSFQVIIVWWLLIVAVFIYLLHYSPQGNWIFAMGGDKVGARNSGIPTERMTVLLFVLSATTAAFVGMCQAILFNSAQVSGGMTYIFNAIVSVVVGGVLLTGGFGSVVGIFFGTITFAIVTQGIYYTSFDRNWSSLIIGVMLLLAVLMNNTFRSMALTYSPRRKK
jgi:simple sugar transport system permease protein